MEWLKPGELFGFLTKAKNQIFNNYDQLKYYPWWYMRSEAAGGPGFSCSGYSCDRSTSSVGARLVFLEYDAMKWATSQPEFVEIYKTWMTLPE